MSANPPRRAPRVRRWERLRSCFASGLALGSLTPLVVNARKWAGRDNQFFQRATAEAVRAGRQIPEMLSRGGNKVSLLQRRDQLRNQWNRYAESADAPERVELEAKWDVILAEIDSHDFPEVYAKAIQDRRDELFNVCPFEGGQWRAFDTLADEIADLVTAECRAFFQVGRFCGAVRHYVESVSIREVVYPEEARRGGATVAGANELLAYFSGNLLERFRESMDLVSEQLGETGTQFRTDARRSVHSQEFAEMALNLEQRIEDLLKEENLPATPTTKGARRQTRATGLAFSQFQWALTKIREQGKSRPSQRNVYDYLLVNVDAIPKDLREDMGLPSWPAWEGRLKRARQRLKAKSKPTDEDAGGHSSQNRVGDRGRRVDRKRQAPEDGD